MKGILVLSVHNWPAHFRPIFYRRFVNNAFLLFRTKDHVEKFKNYLNKQHKNIKFTTEIQENGSLSFLDVTITCEKNKFVISVYRKPTFSGVFINFKSFLQDIHKRGIIETLLHRSFKLCSSYENFMIYNSNFILCTDRTGICFKCHIEKERNCSFEKKISCGKEWKLNLFEVNSLVEGLLYATNLNIHLHEFVSLKLFNLLSLLLIDIYFVHLHTKHFVGPNFQDSSNPW